MNYYDGEVESVIKNEFDYSNIVAGVNNIAYIVQYCENTYNQFLKLTSSDDARNEKLKYEFQTYEYKKSYGDIFEVIIRDNNYSSLSCKSYTSFLELASANKINNVSSLEITLRLDYKRGKYDNLKEHNNSFEIKFKPYEITFVRNSNYNEEEMNQIENTINEMLQKFPVQNSIFCSK